MNKQEYKIALQELRFEMQYYKALSIKIDKLIKKQTDLYIKSFGKETTEIISKASEIDDKINEILEQFEPLDKFLSQLTETEKTILISRFIEDKEISEICSESKMSNGRYYNTIRKIVDKWIGK